MRKNNTQTNKIVVSKKKNPRWMDACFQDEPVYMQVAPRGRAGMVMPDPELDIGV